MPEIDLPEEARDESRHDHPEPPPRAVLEGVVRRDPQALGTFFDYAFPIVYGLAARLLGSQADAEDITQDVFVKAHRAAERLDPGRDPPPVVDHDHVQRVSRSLATARGLADVVVG